MCPSSASAMMNALGSPLLAPVETAKVLIYLRIHTSERDKYERKSFESRLKLERVNYVLKTGHFDLRFKRVGISSAFK
jgi:hypothetical protein